MRSLLKWFRKANAAPSLSPATPSPTTTIPTKAVTVDPKLAEGIMQEYLRQQRQHEQRFEWLPGRFTVSKQLDGSSLANALFHHYAIPKPYLSRLVARHEVAVKRVNVKTGKLEPIGYHHGLTVKEGDQVSLLTEKLPERHDSEAVDWRKFQEYTETDQRMHIKKLIIHEDDHIMIINKPSGLSVQMGPECEASVDRLFTKLINPELRLVHRLDRDASGALIMAKSGEAARKLRHCLDDAQIDPTAVEQIYWAMCCGKPEMAIGEVYSNIYTVGRHPHDRLTSHQHLRRNLLDSGKPAITQWRHLGTYVKRHSTGRRVKLAMLEMRPLTGRKHQLRLHCAEQLRMPIVGDAKYGFDKLKGNCVSARPLHLHCYQIRLREWNKERGGDLVVTAPLPPHWLRTMTDYPLFLPERPHLKRPKLRSNVRPSFERFTN